MIKTNLIKRYKDNNPSKTVQIIKTFFEHRGLTIKQQLNCITDSSSIYSCTIELYYNQLKIGEGYGKGSSEDFCLASGYAELYERFCNFSPYLFNARLFKLKQDLNYKVNGFYLDKDEKQLTLSELLSNENIEQTFKQTFSNPTNFIKLILDNKFIGIPYKSIQNSELQYYNPRLLVAFGSTNGMAAGNTLEEALVQGISELFERNTIEKFASNLLDTYYYINNNSLSPLIKNIILDLENNNKEVRIFDLSYNFKNPIVMTAIRDKISNDIAVNFASNPIFDIAVERTLTEVYQFKARLSTEDLYKSDLKYLMQSFKSKDDLRYIVSRPLCNINIIPESLFLASKQVESFNKNSFLAANDYSNIELLQFIKAFCKDNNINIYYYDNSLCDDMKAIHIYSPELSIKIMPIDFIKTDDIITDTNTLFEYINYTNTWANTKMLSPESIDANFTFDVPTENFIQFSWKCLLAVKQVLPSFEILSSFYQEALLSKYKDIFIDYSTYFRYRFVNKYTIDFTKSILNSYNKEFNQNIWNKCIDIRYLIQNVLFPAVSKELSKEDLIEICKLIIKKDD